MVVIDKSNWTAGAVQAETNLLKQLSNRLLAARGSHYSIVDKAMHIFQLDDPPHTLEFLSSVLGTGCVRFDGSSIQCGSW